MLIPLGICLRSLTSSETLPQKDQTAKQSIGAPRYTFHVPSGHQFSIIGPCALHAFALPELAERENLDTWDQISYRFPHQRLGWGSLRCPCLRLLWWLVLFVPEPRFVCWPARVIPGLYE